MNYPVLLIMIVGVNFLLVVIIHHQAHHLKILQARNRHLQKQIDLMRKVRNAR